MSRGFQRGFMHFADSCKMPPFADKMAILADELESSRDTRHMVRKRVRKADEPPVRGSLDSVADRYALSKQDLRDIDNLIAMDKFDSVDDVIKWSIREGFKANREYLDMVGDIRRQIEELRRSV